MKKKALILTFLTVAASAITGVGFSSFIISSQGIPDPVDINLQNQIQVGNVLTGDTPFKTSINSSSAKISLTQDLQKETLTFTSGQYRLLRPYGTWRDSKDSYTGETNKNSFTGNFIFTWDITNIPSEIIYNVDTNLAFAYIDSTASQNVSLKDSSGKTTASGTITLNTEVAAKTITTEKTANSIKVTAAMPVVSRGTETKFFDLIYVNSYLKGEYVVKNNANSNTFAYTDNGTQILPNFNICLSFPFAISNAITNSDMAVAFSWRVSKS